MKLFYFALLIIGFHLTANGQVTHPHHPNVFKNDLKRQNIKGGHVTMITENEYDAKQDSMKMKSVTKYNEKGNKKEFFTYSPTGAVLSKTTFEYNDSDKLVEEIRYKADGSLNVRTTCKYDEKGNKTEEFNYDISGTLFMRVACKYDGKGNRLVRDCFNEFGALFLKCNSKYDEDGNEIVAKEYDSHKSLQFSTTFEYDDYDKAGNWLKRTTYKNDDPFSVTTREITYQ